MKKYINLFTAKSMILSYITTIFVLTFGRFTGILMHSVAFITTKQPAQQTVLYNMYIRKVTGVHSRSKVQSLYSQINSWYPIFLRSFYILIYSGMATVETKVYG